MSVLESHERIDAALGRSRLMTGQASVGQTAGGGRLQVSSFGFTSWARDSGIVPVCRGARDPCELPEREDLREEFSGNLHS